MKAHQAHPICCSLKGAESSCCIWIKNKQRGNKKQISEACTHEPSPIISLRNMFWIEAETLAFVGIHVALPARKKSETFGCDLFLLFLPAVGPDIFKPLFFFHSGCCAVATPGSKATVSVWGHVSGSPWGREDIKEHDTACLSFSALQLHRCVTS